MNIKVAKELIRIAKSLVESTVTENDRESMVARRESVHWKEQDKFSGDAFGTTSSNVYFFGKMKGEQSKALHVWQDADLNMIGGKKPTSIIPAGTFAEAQSRAEDFEKENAGRKFAD